MCTVSVDDISRHVLLKKILINVSVLCDFVERLCGRLIVLRSYQKTSTFDGITLPRSWIVDMAKDFTWDAGDRKDTKLQQPSLNALVGLLRRIYSGIQAGKDYKSVEGVPCGAMLTNDTQITLYSSPALCPANRRISLLPECKSTNTICCICLKKDILGAELFLSVSTVDPCMKPSNMHIFQLDITWNTLV